MGLEQFINIYCAQLQHRSIHHPDESAAIIYRDYKRLDNERHTAALLRRMKEQVEPLCVALREWEQTAWYLRCEYKGDGTAWIDSMMVSSGNLEEFLGQVIGCYEHSPQRPDSTSRHPSHAVRGGSVLLKYCEQLLANGQACRREDFRHTLTRFRAQTAVLNRALRQQSPAAQRLVNKELADFRPDM